MAAAKAESLSKPAPTWRDNEELEEWSPRQEKQFQKALGPLMGLPPKERWRLVAEKVEGPLAPKPEPAKGAYRPPGARGCHVAAFEARVAALLGGAASVSYTHLTLPTKA